MTGDVRREYVDARCVLLDALSALRPHDRDDVTATMVTYTRDVLARFGD